MTNAASAALPVGGYKALVCIFLNGGADSFNMLVPTDDNKYTLLPVPCLGACDKAPVMMVGDELHEDLTVEKIDIIVGGGET